jgi:hypothetical protein
MVLWKLPAFALIVALLILQTAPPAQSPSAPDANSISGADLQTLTIHFERTPCFGSCPAYTLTIHGDGRVEYSGKDHVKVKGAQEGRIDAAKIKALAAQFDAVKFLSLPDYLMDKKCTCRRCTDMPSVITEITAGKTSHRVNHYYGCACAPKSLWELETAIDKAANSEQWTGDVSQQGPFGTTCF